jgi:septal ring factor EnvC (AmiA/AmiB activator)
MRLSRRQEDDDSCDCCRACVYIGGTFRRTHDKVTYKRIEITKRELDVRKRALIRRGTYSESLLAPAEPGPLELCQHAMAAAELVGAEINAKRTAAEKAVTAAQKAIAKLKSKLQMTTTCLQKAEKRLTAAEKKLAKTEKYEPPTFEDDDDNEMPKAMC